MERTQAQREADMRYYQKNKDKIYARRRETGAYKKAYLATYQRHKEDHKAKALARYYYLKGCAELFHLGDGIFEGA
jgi:hypothetical protein